MILSYVAEGVDSVLLQFGKGKFMATKVSVSQDGKQITIICDVIKELSKSELNFKVVESGGFAKVVKDASGKPVLVHGQPLSLAVNATIPNADMAADVREAKKLDMKLQQAQNRLNTLKAQKESQNS